MARTVKDIKTAVIIHERETTTISKQDKTLAFVIGLLFGTLGGHYFYVKRNGMGFLYLCTAGLCLVGWFIDLVKILAGNFYDYQNCYLRKDEMTEEKMQLTGFFPSWKSLSFFAKIALSVVCGFFAIAVIVSGITSKGKSSNYKSSSAVKVQEKSIPTMFYESGVGIDQKKSVLNLTIAFKDGKSSWPLKNPVEGELKVKLAWSGAGVPANKSSSITYQVKETDFDCKISYCKAKLVLDIPNAFTKAAWLDVDMSFKPVDGGSFRMTKRTMVLNR